MDQSKRRKIQRSHSEHIPDELMIEMLSRLPPKSIVRCRFVSKLWSSITTTPEFIKSFSIRSQPCVLLTFRKDGKRFVFSARQNNNNPKIESYEFTIPNNGWLRRYESVQGLVYLETPKQITIWNPIMKRLFTLPTLEGHYTRGFLGYEPIEGKYKVMCLHKEDNKIGILTLGEGGGSAQQSSSSWRILSKGFSGSNYVSGMGRCINGVIYYEGHYDDMKNLTVMSFDLRSEKFCLIKCPVRCDLWASYEGRLALVVNSTASTTSVDLWILEDNQEWIHKQFPSPPAFNKRPFNKWKWTLKGITDSGEFIYSTYRSVFRSIFLRGSLNEALSIMYVNPKNNTWREVKYGGIGVEDIKRLDEFGFDLIKDFTVLPDHIDSLMPL